MISHKLKIIFIHIPKCAGSSIKDFYFDKPSYDWKTPDYECLYGWCPERKIHMQHATPKQLIETNLIKLEDWNRYFKFTFVRNPWDRAYSDYLWMKKDRNIRGSFKSFINKEGKFKDVLNNNSIMTYRGDHLTAQSEFAADKQYPLDFIGKFENLKSDIKSINNQLGIRSEFSKHSKENKKKLSHYSKFYTNSNLELVQSLYLEDIKQFNYRFEDNRSGIHWLKTFL